MNATAFSPDERNTVGVRRLHFKLPAIRGVIDRRMLVNFRCDPETLAKMLPRPFRPKLVNVWGMAGICLIRLRGMRPARIPKLFGADSENAAHRIAVKWEEGGEIHEGVFIPRRDTNSVFNRIAGGRLFPGVHHAAEFRVWEAGNRFKLEMRSSDKTVLIRVLARTANSLPATSVFSGLDVASEFFKRGAMGWSVCAKDCEYEGIELLCPEWRMEPLAVERVESSFFSDRCLFPPSSAEFDSAFLMRAIPHEWRARGRMVLKPL